MFTGLLAASPPWPVLLAGAAMVFAAGTLRGYTGFGFSIAAVPLLSLLGTPATVVPSCSCCSSSSAPTESEPPRG